MENQIVVMVLVVGSILVFVMAIWIICFSRIKKGLMIMSRVKDKMIARK